MKIGRVLGPRWAACSLRSTLAVWGSYPVLFEHFSRNPKFSGLLTRLRNKNFLKDLALMIDILQEISILSNVLQSRKQNLARADQLISRTIVAFEQLKENRGEYEMQLDDVIKSDKFKKIIFTENIIYGNLPRQELIQSIIKNLKCRLMDTKQMKSKSRSNTPLTNQQVYDLVNIFEPTTWKLSHGEQRKKS